MSCSTANEMPEPAGDPKPAATPSNKKPKGKMSAYIFFCNSIRAQLKAENPEKKTTEIMKLMGERWKALPETEKTPFEDMASKDKERHRLEMLSYTPVLGEKGADKGKRKGKGKGSAKKKKKKMKDPAAPKQPLNAYMLFSQERRVHLKTEKPDLPPKEYFSVIAAEWKACDVCRIAGEASQVSLPNEVNEVIGNVAKSIKVYNWPLTKTNTKSTGGDKGTVRRRI